MIGTVLQDRYRIDAELGRGGMGVVYRAYDLTLDRAVAIKALSAPEIGSTGQRRLVDEARSAARLNHPNVVGVYDVQEAEGLVFIVMELLTGQLPFTGDNPVLVLGQHLHAPVPPLRQLNPEIPEELEQLVLRLLSKKPEERPASAAEVVAWLEQFGPAPVPAGPPPAPRHNLPAELTRFIAGRPDRHAARAQNAPGAG